MTLSDASPGQRLQAVVFDLDGVLVDSEPLHFRATNRLLGRYGRNIDLPSYQQFIGMGEEETWTDWQRRFALPLPLEEIYVAIETARLAEIATGIDPIAPAVALVKELNSGGLPLAIASASTPAVIDALLNALGIEQAFRVRVSGEDPEVEHSKPAPDIYLRATALLGFAPAACLAIEDSAPGVRAAKAAGLMCVAVPSPWTVHQDFSAADLTLESLRYLPALLR